MLLFGGAWGLNTLTSMKVRSSLPPQKPFAAMSSLALSVVLAVLLAMYNSTCKKVEDVFDESSVPHKTSHVDRLYSHYAVNLFNCSSPSLLSPMHDWYLWLLVQLVTDLRHLTRMQHFLMIYMHAFIIGPAPLYQYKINVYKITHSCVLIFLV